MDSNSKGKRKRRSSFDGDTTPDEVWAAILKYELKKGALTEDEHATLLQQDWDTAAVTLSWCLESSYTPSQGSGSTLGVPVMSYKQKNYRPHRIACHLGPNCIHFPYTEKAEASHLCHNSLCYNPWHLVFENSKINRSRYCCELYGDKEGYLCPHDPPCVNCTSLHDINNETSFD